MIVVNYQKRSVLARKRVHALKCVRAHLCLASVCACTNLHQNLCGSLLLSYMFKFKILSFFAEIFANWSLIFNVFSQIFKIQAIQHINLWKFYKSYWNFWKPYIKISGYQEKKDTYVTAFGASWSENNVITYFRSVRSPCTT